MSDTNLIPDYLFEVSWEVCNKVGGIYTVLATKALYLKAQRKRRHILIGPDVWMHTDSNPDFIEDPGLFASWNQKAASQGLRLRIGHWNVPGEPVAILVDYKQFLTDVDKILGKLWETYNVDSISGDWNYKENVLFGWVSGMVIESFCKYYVEPSDKVVAQFHEWQTGSGILYLKQTGLPVATVLTTHATVLGRSLAGNNQPLYDKLESYEPEESAKRFGVVARHSMEKTAANNADVFTTVSEITARECSHFLGREVDVVTPNGFENSITPDSEEEFLKARGIAREALRKTASAMSGTQVPEDAVFMGISGRYEYRNKGIDVFIDSLAKLAAEGYDGKEIHAFIMIPSGHNGPDKKLVAKLEGNEEALGYTTQTSHVLAYPENDTITRRFSETGLLNDPASRIKIYFIPSYLDGKDGVFNLPYYHILIGLDLAVFPSYYEPWGYTPLEACAFSVPTLTTTLAGFGMWVMTHYEGEHPGVAVIERNDSNYEEAVCAVADRIRELAYLSDEEKKVYSRNAREVASIALWKNQIKYYVQAYGMAIAKASAEKGSFDKAEKDKIMSYEKIAVNEPTWKSVMITRHLPEALSALEKLAKNLWWCWNDSAKSLFKMVDPDVWHKSGHNPMVVLDTVSIKRFNELAADEVFTAALDKVMKEYNAYMEAKKERKAPKIAYFCMEYGLDTSLKIYSGGLGILAGDYLKETSDMNVNLVAVGLLYRFGYFTQVLSSAGDQIAKYDAQDFSKIPASPVRDKDGGWVTVAIALPGRNLTARIWKVEVGRTDLYLLDTDFEANAQEDREITYHLYGGDWENRLKQEMLLGIGGIRALRALGIDAQIYHCNEGHAAFTGIERLRELIEKDNLSFQEALEVVRASSLFTTHTPVPAGHDAFDENLIRKYIGNYADRLKIDWTTFMALGKINPEDAGEKFNMSTLAANCSQNVNGVSWLHGKVSQELFSPMYPGYLPEELFISSVTNGVHYPTWASKEWKNLHAKVFGPEFQTHHYDPKCFEGIYKVSDEEVWNVRKILKKTLISVVNEKLADPSLGNHYSPAEIVAIKETLSPDKLTIGFARRFATYKRGTLIFSDLDRLSAIVNNPKFPVQFIFAGKAHPADKAGQDLIKQIVEISKDPRFLGKIVFVPGYDISLAKRLVQGVDVWMNNPTRPQEASGTSGEKASMNGVMHFSVLDGWWVEGYKKGAGWALPMERTYDDQNYQNELDAATMYNIIESEIAPAYYDLDPDTDRSSTWIGYIKNTIAQVACNFTTNRMLTDYCEQYYFPQAKRAASLIRDDYKAAREIAAWKKRVRRAWNDIEVVSFTPLNSTYNVSPDKGMQSEVVLNLGELRPEEIGVEMLFTTMDAKGKMHIADTCEFEVVSFKNGQATYHASVTPEKTGMYQVATRIYPKNPLLPHRQDFGLVRWL